METHGNTTRGRCSEEPVRSTVAGVEPLADPELRQRCASAGRRRYVERCTTRRMAEETTRAHQDTGLASAGESGAPTVGGSASAGAGSVSGHCSSGRGTGRSGAGAVTSSGSQR
jgi:hypothetical protein